MSTLNYMPFTMIADNNDPAVKVANFSNYLIGEFFSYTLPVDGDEAEAVYEWFEAVDCIDYYSEQFGSFDNIPLSLQKELIPLHNTRWMCPNIT